MADGALNLVDVGQTLLTLRGVSKRYGETQAIRRINLEVSRGSIYGILGPNGAGKTTALRSIMGIIIPDEGEIHFARRPLDRLLRDRIGYLPEERGLYRKMKCREQLAYLAELKGLPRKESLARADSWLDRLELGDWRDKKIDALSKGMQQKIQFAATFIFSPDLVILDEVFSGLDPLNIELLRDMILEEKAKGTTILFSTHMLAEAEKICDSICLIERGEVIIDGTLDQVRQGFPLRSVRVAYEGGGEPPADLPGVLHRELNEGSWRLTMEMGSDSRGLLPTLAAAGPLTLFAANRPSLGEIFLEAVVRHRQGGAS